jgi:hypothetical protein
MLNTSASFSVTRLALGWREYPYNMQRKWGFRCDELVPPTMAVDRRMHYLLLPLQCRKPVANELQLFSDKAPTGRCVSIDVPRQRSLRD